VLRPAVTGSSPASMFGRGTNSIEDNRRDGTISHPEPILTGHFCASYPLLSLSSANVKKDCVYD
jgi:hypothetical protein